MGKNTKVSQIVNNIVYVEPNYINKSFEEYDTNGLNTYEFAPSLEDYCIYVNLEVETRGRNVQTSKSANNKKLILSYVSHTDGKSSINFMQGSKIPIGENGVSLNSLTTNYTDIYLGDIKKNGPSTETFGIESIDIAYNNFMVPEVTIEFIDVRGVALFAQKEYYETNKNIDEAIDSGNQSDIANTFFQCFFTFPYPKFTLFVKGFYGQPVSYELTCADFRARFDSRTGNFACTAKFVGYYFSFLNDVMLNGLVAAPYSDYIGADYWAKKEFKFKGASGGDVNIPKIGWLLSKMKDIESTADKMVQSDPTAQEKTQLDQKTDNYTAVENAYNNFVNQINTLVKDKTYKDESIYYQSNTKNGFGKGIIVLSPNSNGEEFRDYVHDDSGQIEGAYNSFKKILEKYNSDFPDEKLPLPNSFYDSKPTQKVWTQPNSETKAYMEGRGNDTIKENNIQLYNSFKIGVNNGNAKDKNPLLEYKNAYYYYDNKFAETLEEYKKNTAEKTKEVEKEIEKLKDTAISEALGFHPTVENLTKIVMAHFETFARMIFETAKTICNENPPRTLASLGVSDVYDVSDVKNKSKDPNCIVPPFPKVVTEVKRDKSTIREESWVGDYSGDFREKDLVHGILNGVKEIAKDVQNYESSGETGSGGGSDGAKNSVMQYPLSPIDIVADKKPYAAGGYDPNDVSSLLGLVGLRGIQLLSTTNFNDWGSKAETLGEADACNFIFEHTLSKEMKQKLSLCADNIDDVMQMMYGNESATIKKPGDGSKPWPWRLKGDSKGIIDENGNLDICRVQSSGFSVPYQNLSWTNIKNDIVNCQNGVKAMWSEDYINSKSYSNVTKNNIFTFDTNINRFSSIAEAQIKDIEGINYYQEKILEESKYDSSKYKSYLTNKADNIIAYIIENASAITPSDGSCMLPTSKNAFSDKSFEHGYNMDYFDTVSPGDGGSGQINRDTWKDKDGNEVKRKGSDGYKKYLEEMNSRDFTFTEFSGLLPNLEPHMSLNDPATSVFAQGLYYKQTDNKSKALLFLASIGYAINHKNVINNFICNKDKTISIIPLPSLMFAGGLLWSNVLENKTKLNHYNTNYYSNELKNLLTLRPDVQRKLIKTFENWVDKGVDGDGLLRSFCDIKKGMELTLIHEGRTYDEFFKLIPEIEDKNILGMSRSGNLSKLDGSYKSIVDMLKGELSDEFFNNYIAIDEDVCGSTKDFTRGMRLGNRDGGKSSVFACNFALASCVFSKNTKYFNNPNSTNVKVNTGELKSFLKGFLDRIKKENVESKSTDTQISQAKVPEESNTDIKIGIYRYCKMLYDKWLAGLSDEEFEQYWTMPEFFTNENKYFHFIDSFYNEADFIPLNIGHFCDEIVSSYRSEQYSLLSFLSTIYSHNRFNFNCVQNFIDLGKRENMENMFDTIPYIQPWKVSKHPNFIVMYAYESSNYLADIDNCEYDNDGFMINERPSTNNIWPEPLKSHNANANTNYTIPAFGVSYGKMYQSYFKDIDISMDNPTVTEQSIKAQFAIACQNNEGEQTGDRSKLYTYGQDLYSIYSNNSYTCHVTMMGCAWVQPMMYFVLNNIPMFRGTYFIIKVSHHIEPGNMVTKFTGVRMSNVCTRIARDEAIRNKNNQSGNGETNGNNPEIIEALASVDNDCPYKEYPLDSNSGTGSEEDLAKKIKKAEGGYAGNIDGKICTMKGVTLETYRQYYGKNKTCEDLKNISDAEWNNIFKKGFWDKWRADEIKNKSIANLLVDWTYNSGPKHGIGKPQEVLGLPQTYKVTDKEINAINNYPNQRELFDKFWNKRKQFFISIANCPNGNKCKFLKGWLNRLNEFKFSDSGGAQIARNSDKHISDLATGFVNALNKTAAASSNNVTIGVNPEKSNGDTLYLTGKGDNFSTVFDMILNTYSNKVSDITWIIPNGGDQTSVPAAYLVNVKEGSNITNIKVANESSPNSPISSVHISKGNDNSGMNKNYCKALVKKYKSHTKELEKDTEKSKPDDYDALFKDEKYKLQSCNEAKSEAGVPSTNGGSGENIPGAGSNSTWAKAVESMGKWYEANIHNYNQAQYSVCSLTGGKVRHDCSGYVSACLQYFGAFKKGQITTSCGFTTDNGIAKTLQNGGFKKLNYSYATAQPFDIITYCGHVEILASKGDHPKSWSWGSCHDGKNGHSGMPAGAGNKPKGNTYKVIWRYVG